MCSGSPPGTSRFTVKRSSISKNSKTELKNRKKANSTRWPFERLAFGHLSEKPTNQDLATAVARTAQKNKHLTAATVRERSDFRQRISGSNLTLPPHSAHRNCCKRVLPEPCSPYNYFQSPVAAPATYKPRRANRASLLYPMLEALAGSTK